MVINLTDKSYWVANLFSLNYDLLLLQETYSYLYHQSERSSSFFHPTTTTMKLFAYIFKQTKKIMQNEYRYILHYSHTNEK